MTEDIGSKNLFMMCTSLNRDALRPMPQGYHVRPCRRDEFGIWKAIHFDDPATVQLLDDFMETYYRDVYVPKGDLFFQKCLFACNAADEPVGTLFDWQAYGAVTTLHWFKVAKAYEGQGIGRGLMSVVMAALAPQQYPVYLHTHAGSWRAIKLYSDFGFALVTDEQVGFRHNDLDMCMPYLQAHLTAEAFAGLRFVQAGEGFLRAAASREEEEF